MIDFNTDKIKHGYLPVYEQIADQLGYSATVCEIGVFEGGSLEMWQHFFPDGLIVGVDIMPRCIWPEGTVKLLMDQADPRLPDHLIEISSQGYDLIVDDGNHRAAFVERSYKNLWPILRPGGFYVIEDWISAGFDMHALAPDFVSLLLSEDKVESVKYLHDLIVIEKKA